MTKFGPAVQNNFVKISIFGGKEVPRPLHGPDCLTLLTLCTYTDLGS